MEVRPHALCVLRCALLPDMLLLPLMMADSSAGAPQMGMKGPRVRSTAILGADGVQVGETRPGGAHGRQHCRHPDDNTWGGVTQAHSSVIQVTHHVLCMLRMSVFPSVAFVAFRLRFWATSGRRGLERRHLPLASQQLGSISSLVVVLRTARGGTLASA